MGHALTADGRLSGARVASRAALIPVLSPSSARGVGRIVTAVCKSAAPCLVAVLDAPVALVALAVGHDPDAVPSVASAKGGSG